MIITVRRLGWQLCWSEPWTASRHAQLIDRELQRPDSHAEPGQPFPRHRPGRAEPRSPVHGAVLLGALHIPLRAPALAALSRLRKGPRGRGLPAPGRRTSPRHRQNGGLTHPGTARHHRSHDHTHGRRQRHPPDDTAIAEIEDAGIAPLREAADDTESLVQLLEAYQQAPGEAPQDIIDRMPEPERSQATELLARVTPALSDALRRYRDGRHLTVASRPHITGGAPVGHHPGRCPLSGWPGVRTDSVADESSNPRLPPPGRSASAARPPSGRRRPRPGCRYPPGSAVRSRAVAATNWSGVRMRGMETLTGDHPGQRSGLTFSQHLHQWVTVRNALTHGSIRELLRQVNAPPERTTRASGPHIPRYPASDTACGYLMPSAPPASTGKTVSAPQSSPAAPAAASHSSFRPSTGSSWTSAAHMAAHGTPRICGCPQAGSSGSCRRVSAVPLPTATSTGPCGADLSCTGARTN